ncbi:MAG: hypothetical protein K0S14_1962 [Thermomicrobiales bacterium]|nr:hypothetical protein [Thermomicrobiales bacterium]
MDVLSDLRAEVHVQPCDLVIHSSIDRRRNLRSPRSNAGSRYVWSAGRSARPRTAILRGLLR